MIFWGGEISSDAKREEMQRRLQEGERIGYTKGMVRGGGVVRTPLCGDPGMI